MGNRENSVTNELSPKSNTVGGWRWVIAAALAGLVLSAGCASILSSTAGAVLLQLAPVGLELFALPAKLELKVTNPSKLTVSVSSIRYDVIIEDEVVASGEQLTPVTIAAGGAQVIAVPLTVRPGRVLAAVKSAVAKKGVKYQVRGSYSIAATSEQTFTAASLLKPLMGKVKGEE